MKQKDVILIVVIAVASAIFAFIISSTFIASNETLETRVENVEKISSEFTKPDERYFNTNSINPTQLIKVNENQNINPFGNTEATNEQVTIE